MANPTPDVFVPPTAPADPAPAPAPSAAPPPEVVAAAEEPEKVLDAKGLIDAVADALDLDPETYVMIPEIEKVSIGGVPWVNGDPAPGRDDLSIFFIGVGSSGESLDDHLAGDYRIYVRPLRAMDPLAKAWRLYTFNRGQPGSSSTLVMPQATWIDLIAKEKRELAIALEITVSEEKADEIAEAVLDERERCLEWLRANALENAAARMKTQLEAEDDEDDEGDDDEEDDEDD